MLSKENRQILRCRSCCWGFSGCHTQLLPSFFVSDVEINVKSLLIKHPEKSRMVNKAERLAESHSLLHPDKQNAFYCGLIGSKSMVLRVIPGNEGEWQEMSQP